MSDYLLQTNKNLTIDQKRRLFAIKNKMMDIPSNLYSKTEHMEHIYSCETLNQETRIFPNEKICNGNINEQNSIFQIFERRLEIRGCLFLV